MKLLIKHESASVAADQIKHLEKEISRLKQKYEELKSQQNANKPFHVCKCDKLQ